jgi:phosphorylcholine metabolism protein LicD
MSELVIAQKKMANMLNVFHNICCKLNINYWCLGGTLIGAVRHSGFIPWDGDIDVAMVLDDYLKLEKQIQEELPSTMYFFGKSLKGLAKIRDLYSSYTKYSDKNDDKHHGLQLDIFIFNTIETDGLKHVESVEKWLAKTKQNLYKYDDIFPLKTTKFDDFDVFIPNNVEHICEYTYGAYPPPMPPKHRQICHEGKIDPINPAPYYLTVFKDIYTKKEQQQQK